MSFTQKVGGVVGASPSFFSPSPSPSPSASARPRIANNMSTVISLPKNFKPLMNPPVLYARKEKVYVSLLKLVAIY